MDSNQDYICRIANPHVNSVARVSPEVENITLCDQTVLNP